MKIVINKCYGGFGLTEEFMLKYYGVNEDVDYIDRNDEKLIKALEEYGIENAQGEYSELVIIEIDDSVTDWIIDEYDGWESLIYVLNGKIKRA